MINTAKKFQKKIDYWLRRKKIVKFKISNDGKIDDYTW